MVNNNKQLYKREIFRKLFIKTHRCFWTAFAFLLHFFFFSLPKKPFEGYQGPFENQFSKKFVVFIAKCMRKKLPLLVGKSEESFAVTNDFKVIQNRFFTILH